MSCVRCEPVRSPPGPWPVRGVGGIVRRDVLDASRRHPAASNWPGTQTRCSRALGSNGCTSARPATAFYTDRADPEFRLRRPLRHQRPSPTAATIRSDSNGSRARHEVLSEYSHNGALRKQDLVGLVPFLSDLLSDMYMHYILHYIALHSALHQKAWCGFLMPPFLNAPL